MEKRIKSLKSTFVFLFLVSFLYTWNARAAELPSATKAQLHHIIGELENAGAQVGLKIDDLGTVKNPQQFPAKSTGEAKVLFSYRATQSYMSASNWKLFTAFYALNSNVRQMLDTEIELTGPISSEGVLKGSIYLIGAGDPSLNVEQLHAAALALKAKGLREITGTVKPISFSGGETLGGRYPFGWTLDDALWYYAPPIGSLAINRNQIDVLVTGGKKRDDPATVTYSPALPDIKIKSSVLTGDADLSKKSADDLLHWDRFEDAEGTIFVSGRIAPGQQITEGIAISHPDQVAAKVLLDEMQKVGIVITDPKSKNYTGDSDYMPMVSHGFLDIPATDLRVVFTKMLKNSDNFYAEMILRKLQRGTFLTSDMDRMRGELFALLKKNGINTSGLRMEDGSGLSRYSLITPNAMTELLNAFQKLPTDKGNILWNALPIAGVDGTLGKRMKSTFAQNNVRAKTGTFSTACNLSGYVTTRDGHRLAVSFLTNFGPETDICRAAQDETFELLAASNLS